jgi:site-specific DNA-cytosine methylase
MAEGARRAGVRFDIVIDQDPNACTSYTQNLGHAPVQMDARDFLQLAHLLAPGRRVGLLVADPPCTPWSRAGKRQGLGDDRDMLAVTVELVRTLEPECWLIANVPGLDDGPNWPIVQKLIGSLYSVGYCIDFARLDAADYGVPQHRVRPFWFGHRLGTPCIRWPAPTHGDPRSIGHEALGDKRKPWMTCRDALQHLSLEQLGKPVRVSWARESYAPSRPEQPGKVVPCSQPGNRGAVLVAGSVDHQLSDPDEPARTLTTNTHTDGALLGHSKHPISQPDAPSYTVTARDTGGAQGAQAIAWPWDRPCTTVFAGTNGQTGGPGKGSPGSRPNAVKLSELAGAILQGFPEHWHFAGATKKARWAQIGMAMPPGLAEPVFRAIVAQQRRRSEVAA